MPVFPFFRYQYPYYYRNYRTNIYNPINNNNNEISENTIADDSKKVESNKRGNSIEPIFELFGIKLFSDDLIILALLFFLYNEGVKDEMLFLILVLLLLS